MVFVFKDDYCNHLETSIYLKMIHCVFSDDGEPRQAALHEMVGSGSGAKTHRDGFGLIQQTKKKKKPPSGTHLRRVQWSDTPTNSMRALVEATSVAAAARTRAAAANPNPNPSSVKKMIRYWVLFSYWVLTQTPHRIKYEYIGYDPNYLQTRPISFI